MNWPKGDLHAIRDVHKPFTKLVLPFPFVIISSLPPSSASLSPPHQKANNQHRARNAAETRRSLRVLQRAPTSASRGTLRDEEISGVGDMNRPPPAGGGTRAGRGEGRRGRALAPAVSPPASVRNGRRAGRGMRRPAGRCIHPAAPRGQAGRALMGAGHLSDGRRGEGADARSAFVLVRGQLTGR